MKTLKLVVTATVFLFLAACGNEVFEGQYEAAAGVHEFNFQSDGQMVQSLMGNKIAEFKFDKEGDEIKVYMSDNVAQTFTLQENGNLIGPAGVIFTPKK